MTEDKLNQTCMEVIAVILTNPGLVEAMKKAGFDKKILGDAYDELARNRRN